MSKPIKNLELHHPISPRSQVFTIRTDPKPVNNLLIFFQALKRKNAHGNKNSPKRYCDRCRTKNQSNCRIRYRARLKKKKFHHMIRSAPRHFHGEKVP